MILLMVDYGSLGIFSMRLVSLNAQGSCRMGADRKKAVVDPLSLNMNERENSATVPKMPFVMPLLMLVLPC